MDQIVSIGLILIVLGVLAVLYGLFLPVLSGQEKGGTEIRGGAVIFIGPIPIIIGTDKYSAITIAILAVILMALAYFLLKR